MDVEDSTDCDPDSDDCVLDLEIQAQRKIIRVKKAAMKRKRVSSPEDTAKFVDNQTSAGKTSNQGQIGEINANQTKTMKSLPPLLLKW